MVAVNLTFFLALIVITYGYFLKRVKIIPENTGQILAKLIMYVTLPAIIFSTVSQIDLNTSLIVMPLIAVGYNTIILSVSWLIFRKKPFNEKSSIILSVAGFNIGNFAFPIVQGVFGDKGLEYAAMFDVGNGIFIFLVVYLVAAILKPSKFDQMHKDINSEYKNKNNDNTNNPSDSPILLSIESPRQNFSGKQILRKIGTALPLWSYFLALVVNLTNLTLPEPILFGISLIADANMLLTYLCLGVLLSFRFPHSEKRIISLVLIIRYGCGFLIGILCYFFLPFDSFTRMIVFICLILPLGMAIIPIAVEFNHNSTLFAAICNLTLILSFIFLWIYFLIVI